jgi:hypothetical protein
LENPSNPSPPVTTRREEGEKKERKMAVMTRQTPTVRAVREGCDAGNLEAATIIAADPVKYQGLMQEWADAILSKATQVPESEAGPLFAQRAA